MTGRIFYVDDQEEIVLSATALLKQERPELTVEGFRNPVAALEALTEDPPDLLVTDLRMDEMTGLELMVSAREIVPDLPVIVATAYESPDLTAALRGRSLVECLSKPVQTEALVAGIDRLMARGEGFSGAISVPMLPDLIQVYTLSRTTGALFIRRSRRSGVVWFDNGDIVHATCGELSGEQAVYEMLSWKAGHFSLDTETRPPERTIDLSWQEVLLEGCRLLDEAGRDSSVEAHVEADVDWVDEESSPNAVVLPLDSAPEPATPSLGRPQQPGTKRASNGLEKKPTPIFKTAERSKSSGHFTKRQMENLMATEKEAQAAFEKIRDDVSGFIAASLVDLDSGLTLAVTTARQDFDLSAASAFNSELVKQKVKTIAALNLSSTLEDMLLTLSDQLHVIKMVGKDTFIYLAADRASSNLAIIRSSVNRHTANLS